MDFIYEYFQVYLFKIINRNIFVCENFDMPNSDTIEKFKRLPEKSFQHFISNHTHYFCHTIPVSNTNKMIIALKLQVNIDTINATSLAYRASNILLQNADKFTFKASTTVTTCENTNQQLLKEINELLNHHFPFAKNEISEYDLLYIRLIAANCTSDVIAEVIGRSARTVEDKINKIYKKLKCQSRRELIELCNYVTLEHINKSLNTSHQMYSNI